MENYVSTQLSSYEYLYSESSQKIIEDRVQKRTRIRDFLRDEAENAKIDNFDELFDKEYEMWTKNTQHNDNAENKFYDLKKDEDNNKKKGADLNKKRDDTRLLDDALERQSNVISKLNSVMHELGRYMRQSGRDLDKEAIEEKANEIADKLGIDLALYREIYRAKNEEDDDDDEQQKVQDSDELMKRIKRNYGTFCERTNTLELVLSMFNINRFIDSCCTKVKLPMDISHITLKLVKGRKYELDEILSDDSRDSDDIHIIDDHESDPEGEDDDDYKLSDDDDSDIENAKGDIKSVEPDKIKRLVSIFPETLLSFR